MFNSYQSINLHQLRASFGGFHCNTPFAHAVVDQFLHPDVIRQLSAEFLEYDSPKWFRYKNAIEDKKALNDWNAFPAATYQLFSYLNSPGFVAELSTLIGTPLHADNGLHGGGWHCHGTGGNLNPHLDYSRHPKTGLQRKINLIIYVAEDMQDSYGGHLGFWEHDEKMNRPGALIREIAPVFNRAVFFDTSQCSWHGLSRPLTQPAHIFRKSLAVYYLCEPPPDASQRERALFVARDEQRGDNAIEELIRLRADPKTSGEVYRKI